MTPRIVAALRGDLEAEMRAERRGAATGITKGVRRQTRKLKLRLRRRTAAAGLGRRLPNTWRESVLPKSGVSLAVSGVVFSKAPHIILAFSESTVIRARKGRYLARPTPSTPRGPGGRRLTPATWPEGRFGPLRPIRTKRGQILLVADGLVARRGKRGGFRRATVRKARGGRGAVVSLRGLASVVMFILVRQVRTRQRLDPERELMIVADGLPTAVVEAWPNLPAR